LDVVPSPPPPPPSPPLFPYTTLFRSQLRDGTVVPMFASTLAEDLVERPRIALAEIEAMVALGQAKAAAPAIRAELAKGPSATGLDRKSTRLNSSHLGISYAVFCLKKK